MFWSQDIPADSFADEPSQLAAERVDLLAAVGELALPPTGDSPVFCNVGDVPVDSALCWTMHNLSSDWSVTACSSSLPNTHWHILNRGEVWTAWRVHKIRFVGEERLGAWSDLTDHQRREHLLDSVAVTPIADSVVGLIEALTVHAEGIDGYPNTYRFAEVHAIELLVGMDHQGAEYAQFLNAMDGFQRTQQVLGHSGNIDPRRSNRLPSPTTV